MSQRRDIHPLAVIALAALTIRVLVIILFDRSPVSDEVDYLSVARSIVSGNGYALDGVATAYRPPGYPTILAGLFWLSEGSELFVRVFQAAIDTATCILVYDVGRRITAEREAILAAAVYAFFPLQILYTNAFTTEVTFTFFLLLAIRSFARGASSRNSALLAGLLCGVAVLIRPVALFLPFLSLFADPDSRPRAGRWRYVGLTATVMLIVLLPWLGRNLQTFGRLSMTSNAGVNLWIGNHAGANGAFSYPAGNPLDDIRDEFERSDEGMRRAVAFWKESPIEAIALLPRKFAHLFGIDYWVQLPLASSSVSGESGRAVDAFRSIPPLSIAFTHAPVIATSLLALVTLFMSPGPARKSFSLLAALVLVWVVIHLVFFGGARYRLPLHPALILLAVHGVTLLRSRSFQTSRLRLMFVAVVGLLLLAGWTAELWMLMS